MNDNYQEDPQDTSSVSLFGSGTNLAMPSCLRSSKKGGMVRNVSFPDDDNQIVTGILEPESPWKSVIDLTNDDIIRSYMLSCEKHGTYALPMIIEQLSKLDLTVDRNECFSLKGIPLDGNICETLEEILKHVQFRLINLESTSLSDEASVALFDMLEYYESATHLNISSNRDIGIRGWQACSRLIKKTCCLEQLDARNTTLNETNMPILGRAIKAGSHLQILNLENCNLTGRPLIILASALKANTSVKELYLSENDLGVSDASQLGSMLKSNVTLQLLDISHNNITDAGMNTLMDSIIDQCFGLSVLIVWNNRLTKNIGKSVSRLLDKFTGLEMLNIGRNTLGDDFLCTIKEPLSANRNLLKLGMQSTYLSNEAAFTFADIILRNTILQRIDLRDNDIEVTGLNALFKSLHQNSALIRLDLDRLPRRATYMETSPTLYKNVVEEIRHKCTENEKNHLENKRKNEKLEEEDDIQELNEMYKKLKLSFINSRKISLTCESLASSRLQENNFLGEPKKNGARLRSPAPSPIPSPVSSPAPVRSRFKVVKVTNDSDKIPSTNTTANATSLAKNKFLESNSCSDSKNRFLDNSRFKIVVVGPLEKCNTSPNEEEIGKFNTNQHEEINYDKQALINQNIEKKNYETQESEKGTYKEIKKDIQSNTNSEKLKHENPVRERKKSIIQNKEMVTVIPNQDQSEKQIFLEISPNNSNSTEPIFEKPKESNPITDKIRKLSWVSPIFQSSSVIDTNKIPANLEKLLGLFQNPFSKNCNKPIIEPVVQKDDSRILVESNRILSENSKPDSKMCTLEIEKMDSKIEDKPVCCEVENVCEILKTVDKNDINKNEASYENNYKFEPNEFNNQIKYLGLINENVGETDSKTFPATWPQKLTTNNFLCSPTRSSPNILEATAFVLLQGHVSSDLAGKEFHYGIQNINLALEEKTADQA